MKITNKIEQPAEYYDKSYIARPDQRVVPRQKWAAHYIDTILKDVSILDVGCGCGTFAEVLKDHWKYRGFDFSSVAIEKANDDRPGHKFWVGDMYDIKNYEPHDYNVIICGQVLEHTDDLKLIKMFPEDVYLVITIPKFDDPAHTRYYEGADDAYERFKDVLHIITVTDIIDNQILLVGKKK